MDYTQLDIEHKREMAVNSRALILAFSALEHFTKVPQQEWEAEILKSSFDAVSELTGAQVEQLIQSVESSQRDGHSSPDFS